MTPPPLLPRLAPLLGRDCDAVFEPELRDAALRDAALRDALLRAAERLPLLDELLRLRALGERPFFCVLLLELLLRAERDRLLFVPELVAMSPPGLLLGSVVVPGSQQPVREPGDCGSSDCRCGNCLDGRRMRTQNTFDRYPAQKPLHNPKLPDPHVWETNRQSALTNRLIV
jgi:hypothetical protein